MSSTVDFGHKPRLGMLRPTPEMREARKNAIEALRALSPAELFALAEKNSCMNGGPCYNPFGHEDCLRPSKHRNHEPELY